jgi:hypothetical protein
VAFLTGQGEELVLDPAALARAQLLAAEVLGAH